MRVTWSPPSRDLTLLEALGLVGAAGWFVARFIPVARLIPLWGCPFRAATGWPCPGCGLTRAADRLAHLHWAGALDANPLGAVAGILLALCAVLAVVHLLFKTRVPTVTLGPREARVFRWGLLGLVTCNYAWVILRTRFPGWL
jgi:hypothetical protein